jgi:hypothetical protein
VPPPKVKPKGKKAAAAAAALQASQAVPSPAAASTAGQTSANPLIAQLNAVAASDPLLAEILRLAATKQANHTQLQALARYIQALQTELDRRQVSDSPSTPADGLSRPASTVPDKPEGVHPSASPLVQGTPQPPTPSSSGPPPPTPSRPLILVEFRESSTERWSLPSSFSATLSKSPTTPTSHDGAAVLSFYLVAPPVPPSKVDVKRKGKSAAALASRSTSESSERAYPVVVRLTGISRTMWEGIQRCTQLSDNDPERTARDEQWARFAEISPPRVYLQFRLKGPVEKVCGVSRGRLGDGPFW